MQGDTERHPTPLIHAHIHLHDCYAPDAFLEHAHRNFERAEQQRGWEPALGVLSPADVMGSALWWGPERREAEVDATDAALPDAIAVPSR